MFSTQARVAFGTFEADLASGELYKAGFRIKLQSQPFRLLVVLLERPGEVIGREELQQRLWSKDTTVDFDHSLGTAINKLREALGDSADNPRFVETLARRGYRFIAPVTFPVQQAPLLAPGTEQEQLLEAATPEAVDVFPTSDLLLAPPATPETLVTAPSAEPVRTRTPDTWPVWAWLVAALVLAGSGFLLGRQGRTMHVPALRQITQSGRILPALSDMESFPASVTDGVHLFAAAIEDGRPSLVEASAIDGRMEQLTIPGEIAGPSIGGISPDGSRLLLRSHLSNESEQPLWIVPVAGGSAQRVPNVLAHDATWMPNGSDILFAAGNQLLVDQRQSGTTKLLARVPGRAFWLRWSADGTLLRFTIFDPITHERSLWQLAAGSSAPSPLLQHWKESANVCCGVWTADGSSFVFQASHGMQSDLWRLSGNSDGSPERLTDGPMMFQSPLAASTGHRIFFTGVDTESEVDLYRPGTREFAPAAALINNANRLEYSRNGQWLAWTDLDGRLWRSRPDGTEKLQLTPDAVQAFLVRWSPDGTRLAFMGREQGQAWQIYLVQADGSALKRVLHEARNAGDPTWSADGRSLAFGRVPDLMGKESGARTLEVVDLQTAAVRTLPGSEELFSPRWSPDGRFIAALSIDQKRLLLFDVATQQWRQLASGSFADPVWSSDSRSIYAQGFMKAHQPILRISLPDGQVDEVATLSNFHSGDVIDSFFCGLTADNLPVVRARRATANLYSLDMDAR
ncbi:winged helix-turn-helix domain-containing protein [Acidipila sp. EB88]|uniref:winged helix-turn-helix domain-containing protein n=1 Tax=Acidipila sp. EB88 TaxID=2305226 RepID=UPI000F5ED694|nr:winged helix-turn-helix domain-containing protein [Acidipila sp. EB88]RRA50187.1 CadC family transcriptional regulator [Acidipila sp. EB88]